MAKKRENVNQMGYGRKFVTSFSLVNMHLCYIYGIKEDGL